MSYKSDLQTNNTDLQSILAKIKALEPNSGGSPDTCSVTINISAGECMISTVMCSIVDATGKVVTEEDYPNETDITISNVLCGSIVYVTFDLDYKSHNDVNGNLGFLLGSGMSAAFTAPTTANAAGIITITTD